MPSLNEVVQDVFNFSYGYWNRTQEVGGLIPPPQFHLKNQMFIWPYTSNSHKALFFRGKMVSLARSFGKTNDGVNSFKL
jgi:hypothetical protein